MKKVFVCLWILLLLGTFQPQEASAGAKPRLVILPFMIEKGSFCPICHTVFRKGEILHGSPQILTRLLYQKIAQKEVFELLPLEKAEEAFLQKERILFEENIRSSSIEVGRELGGDFLFLGFLFRFEQRVGSSWGAERPASVAFDLHLFRLRDGRKVWSGRMDETQRPLSENLFKFPSFLRRKGRWLTAEELASVGMDEILMRLPGPVELEEMK